MTSAEILQRRAEIEAQIAGRTVCDHLRDTAAASAGEPALSDRLAGGEWQTLTWAQTRQRVLELAAGFLALGLAPGNGSRLCCRTGPSTCWQTRQ